MTVTFTDTAIIITAPSPENGLLGYDPAKWLIEVKTYANGKQYGAVWQSAEKIEGPDDRVAVFCRDLLLSELRKELGGKA